MARVGLAPAATARARRCCRWRCASAWLWVLERLGRLRRLPPARTPSAHALTRIDIVWAAAAALSDVDVVLGAALKAQHLLMARQLGEPGRLAQSAGVAGDGDAAVGQPRAIAVRWRSSTPRSGSPIRWARRIRGPMVLVAQSFADLTTQSWRRAYESLDQAERLLRDHCTGVSWELSLVHVSRISMLRIEGQYAEAVRRGLAVLAEAQHRGDIFTQARIGIFVLVDQQLLVGPIRRGAPGAARAVPGVVPGTLSRAAGSGVHPRHQHRPAAWIAAAWRGGAAGDTGRSSSARRCCASRSSATTPSCCAAARRWPRSTTTRQPAQSC